MSQDKGTRTQPRRKAKKAKVEDVSLLEQLTLEPPGDTQLIKGPFLENKKLSQHHQGIQPPTLIPIPVKEEEAGRKWAIK